MIAAIKLATATINGHEVDFFEPPHSEPDFPWVNIYQLARAFFPHDMAKEAASVAAKVEDQKLAITFVRDDVPITIVSNPIAQGMCSDVDKLSGHHEDEGPAVKAYVDASLTVMENHWPMSEDEIAEALASFHRTDGTVPDRN